MKDIEVLLFSLHIQQPAAANIYSKLYLTIKGLYASFVTSGLRPLLADKGTYGGSLGTVAPKYSLLSMPSFMLSRHPFSSLGIHFLAAAREEIWGLRDKNCTLGPPYLGVASPPPPSPTSPWPTGAEVGGQSEQLGGRSEQFRAALSSSGQKVSPPE